MERAQVAVNLSGQARLPFDEQSLASAPAKGFDADRPGAGEDIDEGSVWDRVAQNTEESLPNHVWRRAHIADQCAGQLPAAQRAGNDSDLNAHVSTHAGKHQNRDGPVLLLSTTGNDSQRVAIERTT